MRTKPHNREVLYPDEAVVQLTRADMDRLAEQARENERRRMRLCVHSSRMMLSTRCSSCIPAEPTFARTNIRAKSESFHVIGRAGRRVLVPR